MKKAILLLCLFLSLLLLNACGSGQSISAESTNSPGPTEGLPEPESAIYEIEEITDKYYWEDEDYDFPASDDCLDDVETASAVANIILARFQRDGLFPGYSLQHIEYQSDPGIWVFHFWDGAEFELGPCSGFSIAIRKDNAQVLKMWVSE